MRTTQVLAIALLCSGVSAIGAGAASAIGTITTGPTPCSDALGTTCDAATDAAFQRWGANLAQLAEADLGPYGDPATYPTAAPDLAAITACRLVSESPGTPDGERTWFTTFMAQLHPDSTLSDFTPLFDASMELVCPELGYARGYTWESGAGEERPTGPVAVVVPGEPTWEFTSCAAALGAEPCASGGFAPLYERWGARLPFLYNDPDGDYVGPPIGDTYEADEFAFEDVNMSALSLCYAMLTSTDMSARSPLGSTRRVPATPRPNRPNTCSSSTTR